MAPPRGVVSDCIGPRKLGGARRATPAPTAERRPRIAGNISLSLCRLRVVVCVVCVHTRCAPTDRLHGVLLCGGSVC